MSSLYNGPPYGYLQYNRATSLYDPSTVHVSDTGLSYFFQRYLFQRLLSVFKWTLPKWWDKNYFLSVLYASGYIAVFNTAEYGVIPQGCGISGYNVFYQPTDVFIANPLLPNIRNLRINQECSIIKLSPDYVGVYDLVSYYADQMALAAQSLGVNLINSKLAYVFAGSSKAAAESLKKLYDNVASGQPAVFYDSKLKPIDGALPWEFFSQNLSQNLIAGDLLDIMQTILDMFDNEVGIPNINHRKAERMVVDEVNSNNIETLSKASLWLETMREGIKQVNDWWNLGISVTWRFRPEGPANGGDGIGVDISNGNG